MVELTIVSDGVPRPLHQVPKRCGLFFFGDALSMFAVAPPRG